MFRNNSKEKNTQRSANGEKFPQRRWKYNAIYKGRKFKLKFLKSQVFIAVENFYYHPLDSHAVCSKTIKEKAVK